MKKLLCFFTLKKLIWLLLSFIILILACLFLSDYITNKSTNTFVYKDVNSIPVKKVGLLLGTSKFLSNGRENEYFKNRIVATIELYNSGKIESVVISGDNSKSNYNEPLDMKTELMKKGIPEEKIYLDYAGFRTYDSMVRMNKVFGQSSFTIISQEFHNRRAIYIARKLDLDVIGYNAKDVTVYKGFKTKLREKFARVKMFIDIAINKKPKFLGEPILIK